MYIGVIDMGAEAVKYLRKKGLHAIAAAVAGNGLGRGMVVLKF